MSTKRKSIYLSDSIGYRALFAFLTVIFLPLFIAINSYLATNILPTSLIKGVVVGIPIIIFITILFIEEARRGISSRVTLTAYYIIYAILIATITILSVFIINDSTTFIYILLLVLYTVIMAFISQRMIKRTSHGNRLYGQILGLRQFIIYAEKDRLKMLAKDNPEIFYHVLPYAYAFKLSHVWEEHFKDLSVPNVEWYQPSTSGVYNYLMIRSLTRSLHFAQTQISTPPPTTRSGGFSGGGGFGGGGGFSGGGFGGSSGGSW